ncbi:MAG: hypothetical protein KDD69_10980 [Bdellovibrionales bacterium]|nr:hypothetical protein [Bdellovibrionales bacterium]
MRTSEQPRTILQLVLIDETGDSYYRMRWPGQQVALQAPQWRVISLDARAKERFDWALEADLLIVYQSNDLDLLPLLEERRRHGKRTLAEYNDNFYDPPPASPVAGPWSSPLIWQSYERFIEQCDGLIVTGPGLKELFSARTKTPIYVLENHLPEAPPSFERQWVDPSDAIGFGWAGSLGHIGDVVSIIPVLRELLAECPRLVFHLMGNDALPGMLGLPPERFRYTNWGTMAEYYRFWQPVHIGFAPLLDTPYNRCRSDIKAVEMASRAVLPLLSEALPYQQFIAETNAPVFRSQQELKQLVLRYVHDLTKLRADAERCYTHTVAHRIGVGRTERLDLYESMCRGEPSSFSWPMTFGYHELQGTPQPHLKYSKVMTHAQELIGKGQRREALVAMQAALIENPFTPDLALAELNNLRTLEDSSLRSKIDDYIKLFPRDLRFLLFSVVTRTSAEERVSGWQDVLQKLTAECDTFRRFFETDVVKLFVRDLARIPDLLSIGESLLLLAPNAAQLRLQMGLSFEACGRYKEAREQFLWLLTSKALCRVNSDFLKSLEESYLKTWEAALAARLEQPEETPWVEGSIAVSATRKPPGKRD